VAPGLFFSAALPQDHERYAEHLAHRRDRQAAAHQRDDPHGASRRPPHHIDHAANARIIQRRGRRRITGVIPLDSREAPMR
jgi:hypothetical protein